VRRAEEEKRRKGEKEKRRKGERKKGRFSFYNREFEI